MGARLLAALTPEGSGAETTWYHHADRLGTRLLSNQTTAASYEQATLPFGTALDAESTGVVKRRFTSYDRSASTGLDYAVNRFYDPQQGKFTQVDPIGAGAASITDPQSWNMYAYVGNDPINHVDPDGLFFKKLFKGILKILSNK
ncbi:MAG: RHS repeat-associated core domain-containing protein [Pyrinomonadaceae bacterium]